MSGGSIDGDEGEAKMRLDIPMKDDDLRDKPVKKDGKVVGKVWSAVRAKGRLRLIIDIDEAKLGRQR